MGPVRRGLICAAALAAPLPAWAEVCTQQRPGWDGVPVTALGELLFLLQTPIVLILIIATALAVRFRSEWGGLVVVVGWSLSTFLATGWGSTGDTRALAMSEGCIGNSTLFILFAALVCIGVVLYTAPLKRDKRE
ncbi:hypothetical protein SAMN05421665_1903 [Yoonia rosea]|uniref:Uncharacterized protein n=1 Tax=Yoonia rosea TaxID=287098 RepID=A0A1R3X371_9RHOB|nr:hypothetical protein [Yoonia rosea]SIT84684.1 hypothetical protein SAMN05421665_1903 [Yoonia rosea]